MLVLRRFDLGVRPTVDAELLVSQDVLLLGQVFIHLLGLGPKVDVFDKDAWLRVLLPEEWRSWGAFAFHLNITLKALHRAHL